MNPSSTPDLGALRLAERLIQLLDLGSFSSTYKYAVLIALMDLCLELTGEQSNPPASLTTRQLAEKLIVLYWPHSTLYGDQGVLRQGGHNGGQAEILRLIHRFRETCTLRPEASLPLVRARANAPAGAWEALVQDVEWKLIEMPLPRLQFVGNQEDRFLYDYAWGLVARQARKRANVTLGEVRRYQRGDGTAFDNRLLLKPGIGLQLVQLSGVLRPLIYRQWTAKVARMNNLEESRLEQFLFGVERIDLSPVRQGLLEVQEGRCFYCLKKEGTRYDVDHFIPWSRHPDNGIDNLVIAHATCNNQKRDFLAAPEHLERWRDRSKLQATDLRFIAAQSGWEMQAERAFHVTRAIYFQLPDDARLWQLGKDFVRFERSRVERAFK